MFIDGIEGKSFAQIITYYGQHPDTRDRTFLMFRGEAGKINYVSYEEYHARVIDYAKMIQNFRKEKSREDTDRFHVAFYMQNTPEVLYLFGACAFTNSTLVGINNAQIGEKLATDIANIDVDVLFVDEAEQPRANRTFLDSVLEVHRRFPMPLLYPDYVVARKKMPVNHPDGVATISEMISRTKCNEFTPVEPPSDGTAVIIFTSGTTGAPKGIEVPWKKLYDVGTVFTELLKYNPEDVGYVCMPLNHSNSLYINLVPALMNCAKLFIRRRFSASQFVRDLEDSGATIWNSVGDPVMYVLNTVGEQADYSHLPLRTVASTGTNARNRALFTKIFGLEIFSEMFGSTEVGALAIVTPDTPEYSVGKYIPGRDTRIVNPSTGEECELALVDERGGIKNFNRAVGEVIVSQESLGDSAFTGYYNLPDESTEKVDDQGYYHMGDLGAAFEKNGERFLMFLGRTGTDRLRTKGENYSTTFVEGIILKYPEVVNCAVVGVPFVDSNENDNPLYVLETTQPAYFDIKTFYGYCNKELPAYALPGFVRLIPELPMTETRKIKKVLLLHDFVERTPEKDRDKNDIIYVVEPGGIREFRTADYKDFMSCCVNPTVQNRFAAVTRRMDLFTT
jgi:fatty-acyl-CoA synthase